MESTGDVPSYSPMGAFGMDIGSASLAETFIACTHCLKHASAYDEAHAPPSYALKLSLLKLRLSRWGEANSIYQEHTSKVNDCDVEDVNDAKSELSQLLNLLDVDDPATDRPVLAGIEPARFEPEPAKFVRILPPGLGEFIPLLKTIDTITAGRTPATMKLTVSSRLAQYQGRVSWSSDKLEEIAHIIDRLEKVFGTRELRDLSAEERQRIALKHPYEVLVVGQEAMGIDPWISMLLGDSVSKVEWVTQFLVTGSGSKFSGTHTTGVQ